MKLLIKNGRVLDPNPQTKTDAVLDLLVENGVIVKTAPDIQAYWRQQEAVLQRLWQCQIRNRLWIMRIL